MYAAINSDGRIIAIHKKLDVLEKYTNSLDTVCQIIKIKKTASKKLPDTLIQDLYLVKYRNVYVPKEYSRVLHRECGDLIYIRDTLNQLLEDDTLTQKERKNIVKTILIIERVLDDSEELPDRILDEMMEMDDTYNRKILEE